MYLPSLYPEPTTFGNHLSQQNTDTLLEQGSGTINEDVLLQQGNVLGVFDGATSLHGRRFQGGMTGGRLAATIAAQAFAEPSNSLIDCARSANQHIQEFQQEIGGGMRERHRLWSTSCAVVRLNGSQLEFCQTGDALILFLMEDGSYRFITPDVDIDQETLQLWKEMEVEPGMHIHEVLADQIRKVRLQMNRSYGVLNGEPEAMDYMHHGHEELSGVSDILLFTDGLQLPRENPLAPPDWQGFVHTYRNGGLPALHHLVRSMQKLDPQCRTYPRFKRHDDIAAIAVTLNP